MDLLSELKRWCPHSVPMTRQQYGGKYLKSGLDSIVNNWFPGSKRSKTLKPCEMAKFETDLPWFKEFIERRHNYRLRRAMNVSAGTSPPSSEFVFASAPPAKRPRRSVVFPSYSETSPSDWEARIAGTSHGGPAVKIYSSETGWEAPLVSLNLEDGALQQLPFGLDEIKTTTSSTTTRTAEGINLCMNLTEAHAEFFEAIETWIKDQALLNSEKWFGCECTRAQIDGMFRSVLKRKPGFPPTLRADLIIEGDDRYITGIIFKPPNNGPHQEGSKREFVASVLGTSRWKGYGARACVQIPSIWIRDNKFGLRVNYKSLLVVEQRRRRSDASSFAPIASFPELKEEALLD